MVLSLSSLVIVDQLVAATEGTKLRRACCRLKSVQADLTWGWVPPVRSHYSTALIPFAFLSVAISLVLRG
jgi:hypothetical protein